MPKNHVELFCELVKKGETLRGVCRGMAAAGCDLSSYEETFLLKNMLRVIRDQPTVWET